MRTRTNVPPNHRANNPCPPPPPPYLSDHDYWYNPPSKEGFVVRDLEGGTTKWGEQYKGFDDLRRENENPQGVRTEYIFLPPNSVAPLAQVSTSKNRGIFGLKC